MTTTNSILLKLTNGTLLGVLPHDGRTFLDGQNIVIEYDPFASKDVKNPLPPPGKYLILEVNHHVGPLPINKEGDDILPFFSPTILTVKKR